MTSVLEVTLGPSETLIPTFIMDTNMTSNNSMSHNADPYTENDYNDFNYDYYNIEHRASNHLSKPDQIIAIVVGLSAIIANLLSMIALLMAVRRGSGWTSHFQLLLSLIMSDILVAMSVLLHVTNKVVNPGTQAGIGDRTFRLISRCGFMIVKGLNTMGLNVTLMNLMAMALDHYLAIIRPLHHKMLLNARRCKCLIVFLWIAAAVTGFSDFLSPLPKMADYYAGVYNYCEYAWLTKYQEEYTVFATAGACLFLMLGMYIRIYLAVRGRMAHTASSSSSSRLPRQQQSHSRRTLFTTLIIIGSFVVCFLPSVLFQLLLLVLSKINMELLSSIYKALLVIDNYLYDLMLLNTLLDPIIYASRITEIQRGYRLIIARCCCRRFKRNHMDRSFSLTSRISVDFKAMNRKFSTRSPCVARNVIVMKNSNASLINDGGYEVSSVMLDEQYMPCIQNDSTV